MPITAPNTTPPRRVGEPNVAVLLTWFVPGAGHIYMGRYTFGFAALLVVGGLYWLGVHLSGGLFLEYLPEEMRGRFAGALTPEVGNLGGLLLHLRSHTYLDHPVPWPSTMDLGTTLTSTSGILNLLLMSKAHFDARQAPGASTGLRGPAELALASWLLPGLGHFLQGRKARGLAVGGCLIGLFLLGCFLAEGANLDRERHFYYWAGQFLLGLTAIFAEMIHGHAMVRGEIPYADAGVVLGCIAGMLNVLVMLDVYGFQEARLLDPAGQASATASASEGASADAAAAAGDASEEVPEAPAETAP